MKCPVCDSPELVVTDSRPTDDDTAVRRRRRCLTCGHRLTTMETPIAEHRRTLAQGRRAIELQELLLEIDADDADLVLQMCRRFAERAPDAQAIPFFRRQLIGADA